MPISRPLDDQGFDRLLKTILRQRYAAVVREPVPEALLKLLQDDEAR